MIRSVLAYPEVNNNRTLLLGDRAYDQTITVGVLKYHLQELLKLAKYSIVLETAELCSVI